jgi:hypothetical protein
MFGSIWYLTNSLWEKCAEIATRKVVNSIFYKCPLILSVYFLLRKMYTKNNTVKIIRVIIFVHIYTLFRVLNFMLLTCRQNFTEVARTHIRLNGSALRSKTVFFIFSQ